MKRASDGKLCQKLFTVNGNIRDDEGRKLIFHNFPFSHFLHHPAACESWELIRASINTQLFDLMHSAH